MRQQPGHVPVRRDLVLPREHRRVFGYLAAFDRELRIRRSIERPTCYVLERRCRRRPAVNASMTLRSDMHLQARDGYIHVSLVHPQWLFRPWKIVEALQTEGADTWAAGGAAKVDDELRYEERWQAETRKRRRREKYREIAVDHYAHVQRAHGERISL